MFFFYLFFNLRILLILSKSCNAEWSGEIRSTSYSPDGKSVSVVYRVTIYGTDAEVPNFRLLLSFIMFKNKLG